MIKIAFYISDHGFGHASRNIPIIRYILEAYKDIKIIIKTGKNQGEFINSLLGNFNNRIEYYFSPMDVGLILKDGTLEIDRKQLEKKLEEYISSWDKRIQEEKEFLQQRNISVVVSDIVPWIFKATKALNIHSMLISNFTWVDIYKEHLDKNIVNKYLECYKEADKALLYELYMDDMKEYLQNYEKVSLCCRDFNFVKAESIKKQYKYPIVFVSVGRSVHLHKEIDVTNLNYQFIVTDGIKLIGDNVEYLPKETENTQDYVLASQYVITKAGWGTISEVLLAQKKCAVLSRNSVAEDRNTINKLKSMNLAIEVSYEDDFNIEEILNTLNKLDNNFNKYRFKNDYEDISEKIISFK